MQTFQDRPYFIQLQRTRGDSVPGGALLKNLSNGQTRVSHQAEQHLPPVQFLGAAPHATSTGDFALSFSCAMARAVNVVARRRARPLQKAYKARKTGGLTRHGC